LFGPEPLASDAASQRPRPKPYRRRPASALSRQYRLPLRRVLDYF
jgi:hypothetical protein